MKMTITCPRTYFFYPDGKIRISSDRKAPEIVGMGMQYSNRKA
jgi:hypothetical protein